MLRENIYVGAKEPSSTSNLNDQSKVDPMTGQVNVIELENESDNQKHQKQVNQWTPFKVQLLHVVTLSNSDKTHVYSNFTCTSDVELT